MSAISHIVDLGFAAAAAVSCRDILQAHKADFLPWTPKSAANFAWDAAVGTFMNIISAAKWSMRLACKAGASVFSVAKRG